MTGEYVLLVVEWHLGASAMMIYRGMEAVASILQLIVQKDAFRGVQ